MSTATKTETPEETSAEKRRRLLEENRVRALNAPMRDPDFVLAIAKAEGKLRDAQIELDELRAGDLKKNRKAIKRVENQIRGLAEKLAELQNVESTAYQLMGEAREPILMALQRGETIQAKESETADFSRDEHGARIIHRSGEMRGLPSLVYSRGLRAKNLTGIDHFIVGPHLEKLRDNPKLRRGIPPDEFLRRVANDYAAAYVVVEGQATHAGEGGGGFKPKAPIPRQVEDGQTLADMRKALTTRQRAVLDRVCGQGMRVREAATQMSAGFPATIRALVSGLKAAEMSRLAERERREQNGEMPVGLKVELANVMLRGVRA